jgi:SAM-dependent methyltransferase
MGNDMSNDNNIGWEREKRIHFDEIVLNYDKIRWNYPKELYDDIFKYVKSEKNKKAVEIGAGTGKATTPFLDAGYNVTAVELGVNMADFLRNKYKGQKNFNVVISAFEDVSLDINNYDLVYAASSFHWVDAKIGCLKVFSLLNNGGIFALFRNNFISDCEQEMYNEIQEVYRKYYHQPYKEPIKLLEREYWESEGIKKGFGFSDLDKYGFTEISKKHYYSNKEFNAEEYILMLDTMSDHRSLPENNRKALYTGIKEIILRHGDFYKVKYFFQLYMGRKPF